MAKESGVLRKKLDRMWGALFLTPGGRPKSAMLLYSFCLAVVFAVIYGLCYWFLIDVLENMFAAASVTVRNIMQSVIPGLCGSVVCCPLWFAFKDKHIMPAAYVWLLVLAIGAVIGMACISGDAETFSMFMTFFLMLVPTGLLSGTVFTHHMYGKWRKAHPKADEPDVDLYPSRKQRKEQELREKRQRQFKYAFSDDEQDG